MDVSVIIINYNTFELTSRCIEHVIENTTGISYEIIVVDNASTEVSATLIQERFPTITLVTNTENIGFAKGNNAGINKAKCDFILLLNSDAFLKNNAITLAFNFLKANPRVAVATGRLEYPDGRIQHNCQRFPSISTLLFELFRLQKVLPGVGSRVLLGSFFTYDAMIYPDWVWGTFFMFRKVDVQKLPGKKLADDFFMYGEDMQWCMEFRKRGYKIAFIPDARIEHLMEASKGLKDNLIHENHRIFMKMYYSVAERRIIKWLESII